MHTVTPVSITTPDGVERELRFTLGARKRIVDQFGTDIQGALNRYDAAALPGILYALLHDMKGKPPSDVTFEELAEMLPPDAAPEILAAVLSAAEQGKRTKNELELLIRKHVPEATTPNQQTGSNFGVTEPESLALAMSNSGGDI